MPGTEHKPSEAVAYAMDRFYKKLAEVDRAELEGIARHCSSDCPRWCQHKLARQVLYGARFATGDSVSMRPMTVALLRVFGFLAADHDVLNQVDDLLAEMAAGSCAEAATRLSDIRKITDEETARWTINDYHQALLRIQEKTRGS